METKSIGAAKEPLNGGSVRRLVRRPCEIGHAHCERDGDLVIQEVQPPLEMERGQPPRPWVFRFYLCRHHRAAWNRQRLPHCNKLEVIDYIPDSELLPNDNLTHDCRALSFRLRP